MTRREGRREKRSPEVRSAARRWRTANAHGSGLDGERQLLGRVRTGRLWKPDAHVFVKSSNRDFWARARVVYCRTLQGTIHALGLEFYATAHRYNLTFRCIRCGRYEASANYRSIGLSSRIKSKREYIQLGVQDVAGKAKPAVFLSFESCDMRAERHTSLMRMFCNYGPMHESSN